MQFVVEGLEADPQLFGGASLVAAVALKTLEDRLRLEFAQAHGQMIDPYDGAMFESTKLGPVLELIDKAKALVSAQPEEFEVHTGTNLGSSLEPKHEEIYHSVKRSEYLEFIEQLRAATLKAQSSGRPLVFFGD